MKARAATVGVVTALIGLGAGGSFALADEFTPPKDKAKNENAATPGPAATPSPGQSQYGTRPGKGCGDQNHVHTGPPGNPENKDCPATAGKKKKASTSKSSASCKKAIAKAKKKKASKRAKAKARSCRAKADKKARAKARAKAKAKKKQRASRS